MDKHSDQDLRDELARRKAEGTAFEKHLKECRERVNGWPAWKREFLEKVFRK